MPAQILDRDPTTIQFPSPITSFLIVVVIAPPIPIDLHFTYRRGAREQARRRPLPGRRGRAAPRMPAFLSASACGDVDGSKRVGSTSRSDRSVGKPKDTHQRAEDTSIEEGNWNFSAAARSESRRPMASTSHHRPGRILAASPCFAWRLSLWRAFVFEPGTCAAAVVHKAPRRSRVSIKGHPTRGHTPPATDLTRCFVSDRLLGYDEPS